MRATPHIHKETKSNAVALAFFSIKDEALTTFMNNAYKPGNLTSSHLALSHMLKLTDTQAHTDTQTHAHTKPYPGATIDVSILFTTKSC